MKKIAVFPGSFDPITRGHEDIVRRALPLFDEIIIAVGYNADKNSFFGIEKRMEWLRHTFSAYSKVKVEKYQGLTVNFCWEVKAAYILRGLRTSSDYSFEENIARANRHLAPDIETVFLISSPEFSFISSTIVGDVFRKGGDVSDFVPEGILLG